MIKAILLDRKAKIAIIGDGIDRKIPNGTVRFGVSHIKKNHHKKGSYILIGSDGQQRGDVHDIEEIWECW